MSSNPPGPPRTFRRDDLVESFDALALAGKKDSSTRGNPDRKEQLGFVGGFRPIVIGERPGEPNSKPLPPVPQAGQNYPYAFPIPTNGASHLDSSPSPGPRPRPPIPTPQHERQQSLTMQYALSPPPNIPPRPDLVPPVPYGTPQSVPNTSLPRPYNSNNATSSPVSAKLHPSSAVTASLPRPAPSRPHSDSGLHLKPQQPGSSSSSSSTARPKAPPITPPSRPRATSTPPSPITTTSQSGDAVQCSGFTKSGKRCSRQVKSKPALADIDPDLVLEIERYCFQHSKELMGPTGFYSRKTGSTWVKFEDWIPDYLQQDTQISLRVEMEKARTSSDVPGYIYTFEILDPSTPKLVHLKVGRAVNLVKRTDEWSKQCGSKEQPLRGYWPGCMDPESVNASLLKGRVRAGPPGAWCHRLERLIHLELADLTANMTYLDPGWPNITSGAKGISSPKKGKGSAKRCPDCGTMHKEIFTFARVERGRYKGKEWELIVRPVIEKWGAFVEAYV